MFVDRQSTYPNRYKVTPENGEPYYVVLERADEPLVQGTPLNAEQMNGLLARDGSNDMLASVTFNNRDSYHAYMKYRSISDVLYSVNAGCGVAGGKGVVAFEVRQGPETDSPRLGRLEIGEMGVSFQGASGGRKFLYETGLVSATVG